MEKVGFYAGSFDPFTRGHLHVVKVSAELFDKVIVGIGINPTKERRFDTDVMADAIRKVLKREGLSNVEVISYDNLSVDSAMNHNASFLIRGIRNGMDYDFEETLASFNKELSNLDTIYVRAGEIGGVNSTMVMDLVRNNADLSRLLPEEIIEVIRRNR